jgi:hypothetical protein
MKKKATSKNPTQPPPPPDLKTKYHHINAIGPRYQWEHNNGYCGEVSFISAGLYYGQYLSQYDVRTLAWASQSAADREKTKDIQQSVQLLLRMDNAPVAKLLRLEADVCKVEGSLTFLHWVKKNVVSGYPVIMGVFNNEYLIYNDKVTTDGDTEYDHIVPVMGWGSSRPLNGDDIHGDVILLSDNGLYGPCTCPIPDDTVAYYYHYPIPYFLADRVLANTKHDANRVYSLLSLAEKKETGRMNYAIAIKGVLDENKETLPVKLTTSKNYEYPEIMNDHDRPESLSVTLTITVAGLTPGQTYYLYHYEDENDVPVKNFNAESGDPWQEIEATAATWTGSMVIQSKDKAFFRAVNKNAD